MKDETRQRPLLGVKTPDCTEEPTANDAARNCQVGLHDGFVSRPQEGGGRDATGPVPNAVTKFVRGAGMARPGPTIGRGR